MKKYRIRKSRSIVLPGVGLAAAAMLALSSCSLLPEEETFAHAPTVKEYEGAVYKTAFSTVDDVILSERVSAYYVPLQAESLGFAKAGELYGEFNVTVGDNVKKGDVLALLDMGEMESEMEGYTKQNAALETSIRQNEEKRALALKQAQERTAGMDQEAVNEALDAVNRQYDASAQSLNDSLYLLNARIDALQEKIDERRIVAPFDGTITYVYSPEVSELTSLSQTVIKIADSSMSLFRGNTEYWDKVVYDEDYIITVSGTEFRARAATEKELNIPETAHEPGKKGNIYFVLQDQTYDLADNASGRVEILIDKREQVVCVPNKAISEINGETVVYYPLESGVKYYKNVEIGLVGNSLTEILSGIGDGEEVILK